MAPETAVVHSGGLAALGAEPFVAVPVRDGDGDRGDFELLIAEHRPDIAQVRHRAVGKRLDGEHGVLPAQPQQDVTLVVVFHERARHPGLIGVVIDEEVALLIYLQQQGIFVMPKLCDPILSRSMFVHPVEPTGLCPRHLDRLTNSHRRTTARRSARASLSGRERGRTSRSEATK